MFSVTITTSTFNDDDDDDDDDGVDYIDNYYTLLGMYLWKTWSVSTGNCMVNPSTSPARS